MNGKAAKKLRKLARLLAVEGLKQLVDEKTAEGITVNSLDVIEKNQEYVTAKDGSVRLPSMSSKFQKRKLKEAYAERKNGKTAS